MTQALKLLKRFLSLKSERVRKLRACPEASPGNVLLRTAMDDEDHFEACKKGQFSLLGLNACAKDLISICSAGTLHVKTLSSCFATAQPDYINLLRRLSFSAVACATRQGLTVALQLSCILV